LEIGASLTQKENELVVETKGYSTDVVGISSTERRCSKTVHLKDRWKVFYSCIEPTKVAQSGMRILACPQRLSCADEWVLLMLMLKLLDRSLCLIQKYDPNASALYRNSRKKLLMFYEG